MKHNYFPLPSYFSFTKTSTLISGNWLSLLPSSLLTAQSPPQFKTHNVTFTKSVLPRPASKLRSLSLHRLPTIGTWTRLPAGQSHNSIKKFRTAQKSLPYKDQPVNAARGQQSLCIVGIIGNALHDHNAERVNANADGKYTYHCLKTLKRNTDNNYTMHGFKLYVWPNYSTRVAHTRCWVSRGCSG